MRTKIVKWGNSLGLRIPKSFAKEVSVGEGSVVDLSMEDGNLVVKVTKPEEVDLKDLLDGINDENIHGEIDTGDAVGGEVW
jgi:antitoxin MazE